MADAPSADSPASSSGSKLPIIALVLAVVLAPAVTWAVSTFVILPQMRAAIAGEDGSTASATDAKKASTPAGGEVLSGIDGANSFRFEGVVVNLAGTMGTRYLRTTFIVTGSRTDVNAIFTNQQMQMRDAALNVLASLSLADLEEVGARNFIRERLVRSFNQSLGQTVAEQIYFLDFVVQ